MTAQTPAIEPARTGVMAPRWGYQASFVQTHKAAFWLFAILLGITGVFLLLDQLVVLQFAPGSWFTTWLLLALYVAPVALAIYVLDLFEREPISLLIGAFLWGAVIATGLSAPTNNALASVLFKVAPSLATQWAPALVAPPVEETFKLLGVVVIALIARMEIDDLLDGFIYGAVVGLGFATIENVAYFIGAVVQSGGADQTGPVIQMFVARALFSGLYMHVLWSGLTGLGIAYYLTQTHEPLQKRRIRAIGLIAAGIIAHMIWNSPLLASLTFEGVGGLFAFGLLKGLPFLVFLGFLVILAQRREQRWFVAATANEMAPDIMTEGDVAGLADLQTRFRARREMGSRKGPAARRVFTRLQREQINLAMVRTRVDSADHPDLVKQREIVRTLRAQLMAMPDAPVAPRPVPMPAAAPPTRTMATPQSGAPVAPGVAALSPPPPPAAPTVWSPTHLVPAGGLPAWVAPDPAQPPVATLGERLDLRVVGQWGDWAQVEASNGWRGWVDARRLLAISTSAPIGPKPPG